MSSSLAISTSHLAALIADAVKGGKENGFPYHTFCVSDVRGNRHLIEELRAYVRERVPRIHVDSSNGRSRRVYSLENEEDVIDAVWTFLALNYFGGTRL